LRRGIGYNHENILKKI
jgi:hypothetical protein